MPSQPVITTSLPESRALESAPSSAHAMRNGFVCAIASAICLGASHPVAQMGLDDDWSYIKTAQVFAHTGHLVYNGWATAMLGWQIAFGALFIKLFGSSFTAVRISTMVTAMVCLVLFHAILARSGVNAWNAALGTLTLGLSPLFLPLAASFMSDVPGLFVILLCLYLCQRAIAATNATSTLFWLGLATITNIAGGTARQIAWLGVLVIVPATGRLLRNRRGIPLASLLLWISGLACVIVCMRWFARQPYAISESPLLGIAITSSSRIVYLARHFVHEFIGSLLCVLLLIFPILVAWLPPMCRFSRSSLLRIWGISLTFGFWQWKENWTLPWLWNVLETEFSAKRTDIFIGNSVFLPLWIRLTISIIVIAAALALIEQQFGRRLPRTNTFHTSAPLKATDSSASSWQAILWLLGPFSAAYFALLLTTAYNVDILDRYLLPIMAVAILCLLKLYQERIAPALPVLSFVILAFYAVLAVSGTHDWYAWNRARLTAINEVRASGVPRTAIQGGFEYDGWTQIENGGYINDMRLKVPAGAYHGKAGPQPTSDPCTFGFSIQTPAVHPRYSIVSEKPGCLAPSRYPPVHYHEWLPPFGGTIYIGEIPK